MLDTLAFLRRIYERFNARDIDGVRRYLTRQWAMIDPHVEPMDFSVASDGEITVAIRQTVRDPSGTLLADTKVGHVFRLEDGLIKRFDIRTTR